VQRLDGGCIGLKRPMLRYSLMGLERDYQVKILSNQIQFFNTRNYSTNCVLKSAERVTNLNP